MAKFKTLNSVLVDEIKDLFSAETQLIGGIWFDMILLIALTDRLT